MKAVRPPVLLVLAVLALHLLLGHEVQRIQDGWVSEGPPPMPARMQVEFVRELEPQAPLVARRATVPPPRPAAPEPQAATQALPPPSAPASSVEPPPEPVVAAASAPVDVATPVAGAASAAATDDEPGPEWPLSTRLSYVLTGNYRGPINGQAQVEWLRSGRDYQVHLDVGVGPSFAPLITRRMSSQGRLTPDGIAPQRYDEETKIILGEGRRVSVFFLGAETQLASGAREPARRGAQDSASQFVHLTWLFLTGREPLQAGQMVRFPLVLPRRQYEDWQYVVVGEESVETAMGWMPAWHLRPARPADGGDLTAEVWLAPGLQYLPVRLVIRQDADNYVDLKLKRAPQQAAPESTDPARRPQP
ncbi:DUF3108 domain-containing protein [Roseateles sp.]|uniref:DUF3108 domain-containing protein n=1 Tax=Roseateles sp. TaxID=1971397 RepID=UPI0025D7519D|nr:DUF3108 domain-containing protein [Roseateles sp.]MBV8033668.1 DUF3108 domain-containing protein [Roseateles sp.]